MRMFWIVTLCLLFSVPAWTQTADTQSSTEPASEDDVILYFRTMHSHDMMQRMMEVQSKSMQQLMRDQLSQKDSVPSNFDTIWKKVMDDFIKNAPVDEMTQAMIPAYQQHFTKGDIQAMNAFYSSPVGQKVLQELPEVTQEGMQAAVPILSKYLGEWKDRMAQEFKDLEKGTPATSAPPAQN